MEFKHFSHNHGLVFHQVLQGSEIHCSGCKSRGSGNVYVCWQCSYFLHEQCFRATRSLKHQSHPLHPLTLVPFPTYPSGSFFCNSCKFAGDGFSYTCAECEFDIHVHCALTTNANPHALPSPVPAPNFSVPNDAQNSDSQPQNPIYPPPHSAKIPNDTQKLPIQPQTASYPSVPNSPFPSVNPAYPPNTALPNETQNYIYTLPISKIPPIMLTLNQMQHHKVLFLRRIPPPPIHCRHHQTNLMQQLPTYSTMANATTDPPPPPPAPAPQPSVSQPIPDHTNNPQSEAEPPTIKKHFSHPHDLKLEEIEQNSTKVCSACEWGLSGSAYCCTESHCTFNLHISCFNSLRQVMHKFHPQHALTLLTAPPYSSGFKCNACSKAGKAFAYTCATCSYNIHIDCMQWPETVTRPDHKHPLTLYYSAAAATQQENFMCNVCADPVHQMAWLYYCRECGFGTHAGCVAFEVKRQNVTAGKTEDMTEQLLRMQEQKAYLDFQMDMARLNAEFIASIGNSWKSFID